MFLFLIILAPVLLLLYLELKNYRLNSIVNRFAGPPAIPIFGNTHHAGKTPVEILSNVFSWWHQYGQKNFRMWIGYHPLIIIAEPKDIEFILTHNTFIHKSEIYDMLHPWLGEGLLTSAGTKWHKHRKMITPSFHFKILQNFHEVMNANSNKFIEKLTAVAAGDTIFDFQEMTHYFTLDVICDTAMGVSINAMDNNDAELVTAFKDMCYNINLRAFHPIKRINKYYKFYPDYSNYLKTLKILKDFTYDVIKMRKTAFDATKHDEAHNDDDDAYPRKKMAFLDTLLTSTIDNRPLTLDEIYEEVSTFIFEGHDTTTSGVAFAIYLLSRHREVQQKVFEEQQRILGPQFNRDATFQEIAEMQYLDMVIKEVERLYPSVPFIGRRADKDYDMNGKIIPAGATVNIFLMALGYNEQSFPDPYRVDPERFDSAKRSGKTNPFEYVPFSAGPRNCIGQKFALLELKTIVSKIVRTFEILPPLDELWSKDGYVENFIGLPMEEQQRRRPQPSKFDPVLSAVLTLKSDNGIHLRLRKRV